MRAQKGSIQQKQLILGSLTLLFVLGMALLIFDQRAAFAYTVHGAKWPNANASYVIDSSYSNNGSGWSARFTGAAGNWNGTGAFNYYSSISSPNHIKADEDIGTQLAGTRRNVTGSTITSFALIVNDYNGYSWYDGTQAPSLPSNYFDLQSVLRHELGHALGLCHSSNTSRLMYCCISTGQTKSVDSDAIYGAHYLYNYNYYEPAPEGGCL
jgi:predicted Zn-dependent protease